MRKTARIAAVSVATLGLAALGVVAAEAATSGTVSMSVSGANFSGTYRYDFRVPGATGGQTGVLYSGTLANTGTTDTNRAHFYAQVSGFGFTELGNAASRASKSISSVVYDPGATKVNTSQAKLCRDRTLFPQDCQIKTYNRV